MPVRSIIRTVCRKVGEQRVKAIIWIAILVERTAPVPSRVPSAPVAYNDVGINDHSGFRLLAGSAFGRHCNTPLFPMTT